MLAHKAMVEGRIAAENVTGGQRRTDFRAVPNVIFTMPEVASVGLTEAQARMPARTSRSRSSRSRPTRERESWVRRTAWYGWFVKPAADGSSASTCWDLTLPI